MNDNIFSFVSYTLKMQTEYKYTSEYKYIYPLYMDLLNTPNNELMLQAIRILHFTNNQLTQLPDLMKLTNLHELYCYNNQLIKLPGTLPPTLRRLDCWNNQLVTLPDSLPPTLRHLNCSNNQLHKLPDSLPPALQILNCENNLLLSLPDSLPPTLQILYCSNNQLHKLPDSFPPTLQTLYCDDNQLRSLPELPPMLQNLHCWNNQLRSLPDSLPPTLQSLTCYNNQLHKLPDSLPPALQRLDCSNNQLTTLPNSIICTQCNIYYSNNPIEYLPVQVTRWLTHVNRKTSQRVYQDTQSVHNHSIQLGIINAVTLLTQSKPTIDLNQVIEAIVCEANEANESNPSFQFQTKSKQLLLEYCGDLEVHGTFQLTFAELLVAVWSHILTYPLDVRNEIWKVLDTEMQDAECKCFTGRMSRLVNCLNGFDDRIKIQISDNEQIGNIITVERNRIELLDSELTDSDLISLLKTNVALALKERAYSDTVIQEWIEYIE